ncbi:MAG: hypothetical protein ACYS9X_07215 [Planctomycetota bacterium]|jgi:hypothetical protein
MSGAEGGLVEVYEADARHRENLEQAMKVLREGGLTPFLMDHPEPGVLHATGGIYRIRIAVPADQAEEAEDLIAEWAEASSDRVVGLERRLLRELALGLPAALFVAVLWRLLGGSWGAVNWAVVVLIWGAIAVAIDNLPAGKPPPDDDEAREAGRAGDACGIDATDALRAADDEGEPPGGDAHGYQRNERS